MDYDSDSSGDEDFDDTGVLLGYAAEELIEDTISHLGGWPKWLDDASPAPGDFANCKVCNSPMLLLLELHGDLPDHFPTDERRLYVFGCPRKPCNRKPGSIRAFRASRKVTVGAPKAEPKEEAPQPSAPEQPKQDLGASLFGATNLTSNISANTNPFSSGPTPAGSNPFATPAPSTPAPVAKPEPSANNLAESFADKVRVSSPPPVAASKQTPESSTPAPWPAQSEFPAPYKNFYLDAEYETISRPSTPTVPDNVQMEPMEEEGAGGAELKDTFESELDKAFMKFSTRLSHNPEQVLRYEFRGAPLLYSTVDAIGSRLHVNTDPGTKVSTIGAGSIPSCEYCGSHRVFEFQLVPHAISMLEEGRAGVGLGKDDAGMEWGTIIMGVCSKDCAPQELGVTGWREEWAGVQWEEMK
ncbi:Programmed cell death protein 2 C-terminal [Penicillium brevicompactum]|uniref:Programmed cell death protein 2 C-terminal n=1 Tax=Penicillium brevicompactum TaxID=5074 RepID=A0A9W9QNE2_PENBR|nr:Programmed cell death protein 2 C-terminal [Penicillium brevicompactum]